MNGKALMKERLQHCEPVQVVVRAVALWFSEGGPQHGAAIAFYTMFAMAPLLVLAIWLAGMVLGAEAARGQIVGQIESLVGSTAAQGIESLISSAWREPVGHLAGLLAATTLLVGASGVFAQLRSALNAMARIRELDSPLGAFGRGRLKAFALVLGFGFLVMSLLLASAALAASSRWLSVHVPASGLAEMLGWTDVLLTMSAVTLGIAGLLRWLPDRPASRSAIWRGALASALLFTLGKHLIGLYLVQASVASSYGAAGSFVVVMMWMYCSAQTLLFGASLAHVIDERQGLAPGGASLRRSAEAASRQVGPASLSAGLPPASGLAARRETVSRLASQPSAAPGGPVSPPRSEGGAKVLPFPLAARMRRSSDSLRQPGL